MGAERKSKVAWYNAHLGGNLDGELRNKISGLLDKFGIALEDEAKKSKINIYSSFAIFREFHLIVVITSNIVVYIATPSTGGTVRMIFQDFRDAPKQPDIDEICQIAHDRYGWTEFWHFEFPSDILQKNDNNVSQILLIKAKEEVQQEKERLEKEAKLVKINPIFKGREFLAEDDLCFVLIPFQPAFLRLYTEYIKPTLENIGFRVLKANDIFTSTEIIEDIWELINKSRIVVADVTGKNANVFYELGITHTLGKDYIIITQNSEDVPFDVQHRRYFPYVDDKNGWLVLRQDLEKAVKAIMKR